MILEPPSDATLEAKEMVRKTTVALTEEENLHAAAQTWHQLNLRQLKRNPPRVRLLNNFTTRYLRTREDVFARQIGKVPSAAPESLQPEDPAMDVVHNDGLRAMVTVDSLSAFLCLRTYTDAKPTG